MKRISVYLLAVLCILSGNVIVDDTNSTKDLYVGLNVLGAKTHFDYSYSNSDETSTADFSSSGF